MGTRVPNESIYDIQQRLYRIEIKVGNSAVLCANLEKTLAILKKRQERMLLLMTSIFVMVVKNDLLLFFG